MFIFNTKLLLIGIEGVFDLLLTVGSAVLAMLLFAAVTQGYFLARSRLWEGAALLLVAFTLFRPGFWLDLVEPPFREVAGPALIEAAAEVPEGERLRLLVQGETIDGDFVSKEVALPAGPAAAGAERLSALGLELREEDGRLMVDAVGFDSPAAKTGIDFDWEIVSLKAPRERPSARLFFIPALIVLAGVAWLQHARRRRELAAHAQA
jgi:hypothetical protein